VVTITLGKGESKVSDYLKEKIDELETLMVGLAEIAASLSAIITDHEARIRRLEERLETLEAANAIWLADGSQLEEEE
jgi:ubiquinone biosynthesis protein UbiJ